MPPPPNPAPQAGRPRRFRSRGRRRPPRRPPRDQPRVARRRRARRLHLGCARPAARRGIDRDRGDQRHLGRRDERRRPQARLGAGRQGRRARVARAVLAPSGGARRHQRGDPRLDARRLPLAGADRPAARAQPAGHRGRRDHTRALALPVQPGQLPPAAGTSSRRCSIPTRSARTAARGSSSTPPTCATASRGCSRARRSPPTPSSPPHACPRSIRRSRSTTRRPAAARPTGTAATSAIPRSTRCSTAPPRRTSSSSTSTRSTARNCPAPRPRSRAASTR